jgi:Coenzyme PQQ synthesis protein D (PqqD)
MTDLTTRVTVLESVLFRDLDGEAVLLETGSGRYYGLDEVGTRMWSLLQIHGETGAVCRALLAEYDVPEERLREDLGTFVEILAARGLLEVEG